MLVYSQFLFLYIIFYHILKFLLFIKNVKVNIQVNTKSYEKNVENWIKKYEKIRSIVKVWKDIEKSGKKYETHLTIVDNFS